MMSCCVKLLNVNVTNQIISRSLDRVFCAMQMTEAGKNKTVVIIAGPTAVGKTAVAIDSGQAF